MFDKTTVHVSRPAAHQTVQSNVKITEKRAPTDESVALLSEMESKAKDRILNVWQLDNNDLSAIWAVESLEFCHQVGVAVKFKLNRNEKIIRMKFDIGEDVQSKVRDRLIEELADELLKNLNPREIQRRYNA